MIMNLVVAGLVLTTGAAHFAPIKGEPTLTANPIYKKAALPKVSCKAVKGTTKSSTEKYIQKVVSCLNTAWKGAIDDFQPVKVIFKKDAGSCSGSSGVKGSYAEICYTSIQVRLADDWIKARSDEKVFAALIRTWNGVVQGMTGIAEAYWALPNDRTGEDVAEQTHRYFLQGDCLAGISARSLGRKITDFSKVIAVMEPKELARLKHNGKPANRVFWMKKGYQSGKPGACNTWTASASKVV
ncbi:hypothetical protein [Herbidospora yilanensis]|uniref:hypothetical protein n=1 Tax=Herbidospora yilanensis TaxID=354426 RepID=UPI0012F827C5|nr:hypothetical protein [Herbidospora yilanensis]